VNENTKQIINVAHSTGGFPVGKRQLIEIVHILKLPEGLPHGDLDDEFQRVVMREASDVLDMDTVRNIVLTCSGIAKRHYKCPWCDVPTGDSHTLQLHIGLVHFPTRKAPHV
jgi:hypothetical protein